MKEAHELRLLLEALRERVQGRVFSVQAEVALVEVVEALKSAIKKAEVT